MKKAKPIVVVPKDETPITIEMVARWFDVATVFIVTVYVVIAVVIGSYVMALMIV